MTNSVKKESDSTQVLRYGDLNPAGPAIWVAVAVAVVVAAAVRVPLMAEPGFGADVVQFVDWAYLSKNEGMAAVYQTNVRSGRPICNYPPGYIFALRGLASAHDLIAPAGESLNPSLLQDVFNGERSSATRRIYVLFKLPGVLCDVVLAGLLAYIIGRVWRARSAWAVGLAYALLPAAIHNSAIWGQVDSILALLLVAALWYGMRGRMIAMTVCAWLAFLTKAQAAMLMPVFAYLLIDWARWDSKRWGRAALAIAITITMVVLPFLSKFAAMWKAYADAASYYPFVHLNGFSGWFLLSPIAENHLDAPQLADWYRPDNVGLLLGMSPRTIGFGSLLMIWIVSVVALVHTKGHRTTLRITIRTLSLAFFVLSTQMHERYLLPAGALWLFAYEPRWRWWGGWLLLAGAVTINQAWVWAGPTDGPVGYAVSDKLREVRLWEQPIGVWIAGALIVLLMTQIYRLVQILFAQEETPQTKPAA